MATRNDGPTELLPRGQPLILVLPNTAELPSVYLNGIYTTERGYLYWTGRSLQHAGCLPEEEHPNKMLKIWTPANLKPMSPNPSFANNWTSHDHYRQYLMDNHSATQHRTAGIYIESEHGRCINYRLTIVGAKANFTVQTPQPIRTHLANHNIKNIPKMMIGSINPNHMRFKGGRDFTDWMNLHQMNIHFKKHGVPNAAHRQIYCRLRTHCRDSNCFKLKMQVEYIIVPDGESPNGLTQQQLELLDSSGARTLNLWTSSDTIKWDQTYPTQEGTFNIKTPIPVVSEKYPETNIKPSEWTLRRIAYDPYYRGRCGVNLRTYEGMISWLQNKDRTYVFGPNIPTLIMPEIPQHPEGFAQNNPVREMPGDEDGPYEDSIWSSWKNINPKFNSYTIGYNRSPAPSEASTSSNSSKQRGRPALPAPEPMEVDNETDNNQHMETEGANTNNQNNTNTNGSNTDGKKQNNKRPHKPTKHSGARTKIRKNTKNQSVSRNNTNTANTGDNQIAGSTENPNTKPDANTERENSSEADTDGNKQDNEGDSNTHKLSVGLDMNNTETEKEKPKSKPRQHDRKRDIDPGKQTKTKGLITTAKGKYETQRDYTGLTQHYQDTVPNLEEGGAEILAKLTQASVAYNTAKTQRSIKNTIEKIFPDRQNMFTNNKPGDQLAIITRLVQRGYKKKTILAYIQNYESIVRDCGGTQHPKPQNLKQVIKGLTNLAHNPAEQIAYTARKAYSIEALQLVAIRGIQLIKVTKDWSPYKCALYRAVILTLFYGRLRSAEALASKSGEYDMMTELLMADVVFNRDSGNQITHVTLHLRSCKYQEQTGALVVIPKVRGKKHCPVRALWVYIKYRNEKTTDPNLPLFLTEHLWTKGASKPDTSQPGILTNTRFRKDTVAIVRELAKVYPTVSEDFQYLTNHSLRAGISTELQKLENLPESIR